MTPLFIFIGSDNGASGGPSEIHNDPMTGMKGHKGQPYQGGTRCLLSSDQNGPIPNRAKVLRVVLTAMTKHMIR